MFVQGNSYTLKLVGIAGSAQSQAETALLINYPPTGGRFSACLLDDSDASDCIKTGLSVLDTFRLECNSWTDRFHVTLSIWLFIQHRTTECFKDLLV